MLPYAHQNILLIEFVFVNHFYPECPLPLAREHQYNIFFFSWSCFQQNICSCIKSRQPNLLPIVKICICFTQIKLTLRVTTLTSYGRFVSDVVQGTKLK